MGLDALGRILDGAFDEQWLALGVADDPGIFGDPETFSRLVAADLRDEVLDSPFLAKQTMKFPGAAFIGIPAARPGADGSQMFGLAFIAIEHGDRPVGAERRSIQRVAVYSAHGVFEQAPVFRFGLPDGCLAGRSPLMSSMTMTTPPAGNLCRWISMKVPGAGE